MRLAFQLAGGVAAVLCLSACGIQQRHHRQFAGPLASTTPGCPATTGSLVIQSDDIAFSPGEGTWVLNGKLIGDHVEATRSRPSFDHKVFATSLEGTLQADTFHGTYKTPTCTYVVDLKRV